MLANEYHRRVVIVDTSNEIAGDGDISHAGIGLARRMQVPKVDMQHKVEPPTNLSCSFFGRFISSHDGPRSEVVMELEDYHLDLGNDMGADND